MEETPTSSRVGPAPLPIGVAWQEYSEEPASPDECLAVITAAAKMD